MRKIYIFLFGILLTSCSTYKEIDIDVLMPAQYSIPPEIKSVVLVNNSEPYRASKIHEIIIEGEKNYADSVWYDDFAKTTIDVIEEELLFREFFDTVYVYKETLPQDVFNKKEGLPMAYVDTICRRYNADAVITLEDYLYRSKLQFFYGFEGEVIGNLDMSASILWRFNDNFNHNILFQDIQSDTIFWQEFGSNLNQVTKNLPSYKSGLKDLSIYLGSKAVDYFAPKWNREKRGLYGTQKFEFVMALEYVRLDQWSEAIKLWKSVFDKGKEKQKFMAAYNLSVAAELSGDYESAQVWMMRATDIIKVYPSHRALEEKARLAQYSYTLSKRLKYIEKLKKQVGGD